MSMGLRLLCLKIIWYSAGRSTGIPSSPKLVCSNGFIFWLRPENLAAGIYAFNNCFHFCHLWGAKTMIIEKPSGTWETFGSVCFGDLGVEGDMKKRKISGNEPWGCSCSPLDNDGAQSISVKLSIHCWKSHGEEKCLDTQSISNRPCCWTHNQEPKTMMVPVGIYGTLW